MHGTHFTEPYPFSTVNQENNPMMGENKNIFKICVHKKQLEVSYFVLMFWHLHFGFAFRIFFRVRLTQKNTRHFSGITGLSNLQMTKNGGNGEES